MYRYLHFEFAQFDHTLLGNELDDMVRVLLDQLLHRHCRQLRGCYLHIIPSTCSSKRTDGRSSGPHQQ